MILKTPFGYIDILHTWEGWTLIGLIALAVLALWWMEWGKVGCDKCDGGGQGGCDIYTKRRKAVEDLPCHGSGRVRRGWISKLFKGESA